MASAVAALGVFCSAMIYIDTRRRFWRPSQSFGRMGGTVLIAALLPWSPVAAAIALIAKLCLEFSAMRGDGTSARLQRGPLATMVLARVAIAFLALLTFFLLPAWMAVVILAAAEVVERALYFQAVDSPKMPGVAA